MISATTTPPILNEIPFREGKEKLKYFFRIEIGDFLIHEYGYNDETPAMSRDKAFRELAKHIKRFAEYPETSKAINDIKEIAVYVMCSYGEESISLFGAGIDGLKSKRLDDIFLEGLIAEFKLWEFLRLEINGEPKEVFLPRLNENFFILPESKYIMDLMKKE